MSTVAATTKLESVNIMLAAIGESPVNTINETTGQIFNNTVLPVDAQIALDVLQEQNKAVQSEGWSFNTEIDVTLIRNEVTKEIVLPNDILRIDSNIHQHPSIDPIQRGLKMYDRLNNTFLFENDLISTVVYFRTFEEIPEQARYYITIKAARIFIDRLVGDGGLRGYTQQDEARARAVLLETDLANADHNLLRGDPSLTNVFDTYSPANVLIR
tara:strand:+ start:1893 stop:2534 length:642 start_codon:yes stop_codon:yes gene_type:complete